jgi:hypothetical protein
MRIAILAAALAAVTLPAHAGPLVCIQDAEVCLDEGGGTEQMVPLPPLMTVVAATVAAATTAPKTCPAEATPGACATRTPRACPASRRPRPVAGFAMTTTRTRMAVEPSPGYSSLAPVLEVRRSGAVRDRAVGAAGG